MELRDAVVLITGAARRVGRVIALDLARHGARIVVHYHRVRVAVQQTIQELEEIGVEAYAVQADQTRPREIRRAVAQAIKRFGRIDVLVNNAAIFERTPFTEITEADWDRHLAVNLKGPFFFAHTVADGMRRRRHGKIINMCDVAAMRPYPGYLPYSASKAALLNLTIGLARHLAPHVQVNAIAPGAILQPHDLTVAGASQFVRTIKKKTLLGRLGTPEDVAAAVRYLIERDYVTGTTLTVDGGQLAL